MKKVLSILLAVALAAVMMVPAFAYTITITPDSSDTAAHTYEAYQIFTGDLSTGTDSTTGAVTKTLANIAWGNGIDASKDKASLIAFLNQKANLTGANALTAASPAKDFAKAMEKVTADADKEALAEEIEKLLSANHTDAVLGTNGKYTISTDTAGYYFIKDKDGSLEGAENGAYTKYILQVVSDVNVAEKASVPSVDKQVVDEDGIAKEVASYGLYEDIPFILTATVPADVDLEDFDTYYVEFADTFTEGLSFKQIDSVVITCGSYTRTLADTEYTFTPGNQKFNLKIADILPFLDGQVEYADKDVVVTVRYTGYLNENAVCYNTDADATIANRNDVELIYSNNPNVDKDGKGKTNKDYVFVFTYKVDNTKYENAIDDENVMEGAGFTLFDSNNNPVLFVWDANKNSYRPAKTGETGAAEIFSKADGTFNIIGLDDGTYTLKETTTPVGFNTCPDVQIVIDAAAAEDASGTTASLEFDMERTKGLDNDIINEEGSVLPSTGGMGTTILYIVGAVLVIVAGVVLFARRKAGAKA